MKTMVNKVPVPREEYRAHHVNRVKDEYPKLRDASKTNTFALQYAGTPGTLAKNGGFSDEEATQIYTNYHSAYKDSKQYADVRKYQASQDGYATVAFGLRVRTPLLHQVVLGAARMPREAEAEARTVGNAFSQSYGLLNNRAAVDFMSKVWASKYRNDIKPVALVHDAAYFIIRDDVEVVEWTNRELIKAMQWQELPEIQHPAVKLGAQLDIFWPSWANAITLPNGANQQEIVGLCLKAKEDYLNK